MQIKALSVSEINHYIKRIMINDPILSNVYIKGEISNYKLHSSGHIYFTLKDEKSRVSSVMFKTNTEQLKFLPEEGMQVLCRGYISLYERGGLYQFYVDHMEAAGVGALYLAYQQLKEKLEKQGYFDGKFKKEIPLIPRKIAVVTSPTGAAVRDIISVIKRRFPHVEIYLFPVLVQGDRAAPSIARAVELLNLFGGIDVAIIGRGGGSIEELWPFNEETVAEAIFSSQVPIISAVGHETDFTIADFVADLRAPTPSVAAERVVPDVKEVVERLNTLKDRLNKTLVKSIDAKRNQLGIIKSNYYFKNPLNMIYDRQQHLDILMKDLTRNINVKNSLYSNNVHRLGERLNSVSPLSVFSRGYALAENKKGERIKTISNVKLKESITVQLIDGQLSCEVTNILKEDKLVGKNQI
ncbi:exodeoxyribonuclease VII, large subunit [Alkaliphilus metalliredigens QYMF]|uniref:Exodeoxyribonuclease 7 large subunit n=1 Tax=Alkaliphilus metalliredigens (strain QYMF) TaxID=293826 RepID=EX7L_ALKMQ|nr:exodeoxyribonuclease VII large subunit [Alkaliphilus metalliredigens]A6TR38.1 RecName: Full=Exodeoxyribonuclease 7 large subunit; AltName: Full=Exodeoxyribonuclease VII large subunit; Short=Exonuclease VII large subunit [Alkaliphilus metalliredigens QYMF]ABR48656.1 exodeoxyribonuclease VII, large subunit [Alkaliphilus metalliredigens QYMF]